MDCRVKPGNDVEPMATNGDNPLLRLCRSSASAKADI
jgi:hypothetical protein